MAQLFKNNARTTLASSLASGSTTLHLAVGTGVRFPTLTGGDTFLLTLQDATNIEIVNVTARSTDTLTIVRAQEGTTSPATFASGTVAALRMTAGVIEDIVNHAAETAGAHAASAIANTPSGNLAATTVQTALNELQTDIDTRATSAGLTAHIDDTVDAHDATAISYAGSTNLSATTVEAALDELDSEKQPLHANLTAEAGLTGAANKLAYYTGAGAKAVTDLSAFGRTLIDDADAAAGRTTLELETVGQAEAEAGTATTTRAWTAARVKQAIAAQAGYDWPARVRTLAAGTTYTLPSDVKKIRVFVRGATGGQAATGDAQGGVGGAGYAEKLYLTPAASYAMSIGAGGVGGTAGGTTTFDTISITGSGAVTGAAGSSGGVASGGDFNASGGAGGARDGAGDGAGGGGAGGGRAGNGYAGGAGSTSSGGGGGGGGGTGAAGTSGGTGTAGRAGGAAATTLSATAIVGLDSVAGFTFSAGSAGQVGNAAGSGLFGDGGAGASGTENGVPLVVPGGAGGAGGAGNGSTTYTANGTDGGITIWEYI
jgi:hypothetical protein